jgi:toxin-antitoxin system PIN domain toxin
MFVVDTNILLYAADRHAPEHRICHDFLSRCREGTTPWRLTWGIVYEFLRVATHPRVFHKPMTTEAAWAFIHSLLVSPGLSMLLETERHMHIAREVFAETPLLTGNLVFDAHAAVLMREHGIQIIYTRDTDFHRFPFLKVVDPLSRHS